MRARLFLIGCALPVGCQPAPRSASYFKANHDEARRVAGACKAGRTRGAECDNAEAGVADAQIDADMQVFRRGF